MSEPIWTPSAQRADASGMARFLALVRDEYAPEIANYAGLYRWSVENPRSFWPAVWGFCGMQASRFWQAVLEDGDRMPGARWFRGAELNFAENLLRFRDSRPAIVFRDEAGNREMLTHAQLYRQVAGLASALRRAGLRPGDRVAGYLPNRPETVIAMLATTACGAIWSSCSPDFGVRGVLDRFGQIEPRFLFAADGYYYNGKRFDCLGTAGQLLSHLPSVQRLIVVPYTRDRPNLRGLKRATRFDEFLDHGAAELRFEQLPFDHPVYILFSSGTTGAPKCIVHGAGGTILQHLKEHVLHTDLGEADTLFYFTTCGWMMWNWQVSALATGACLLLYDGSPFQPGPEALWQVVEQEAVTVFGTSAKYLSAVEKAGLAPRERFNLGPLKTILSTGSPLLPEGFDYVYRHVKEDVCLSSISGGTDIVSCFALGNPMLPVYRGELQCRGLGMQVEVFDENGHSVRGEKGELVCTAPFPSMPVSFWNDPGGQRYQRAYFETFPGVWSHGDYAELTEQGGMIIYGRSDAVLNPGGVRIGTAEIYRQVEALDEVVESIAVGQRRGDDERVVLFVRLREGLTLDDALRGRIRAAIRENASPRHVPARILQVDDIPRTRSGKITELAVRRIIHGEDIGNREALANPEALEQFRHRPELDHD
ncbi:MAG TPA: acetoacetate--CoA ligase [Gammaproteobacteria bacterium]|nr:acetoacetate--CoA ligase [Gammaproteobacteria bacterium]